MYIYLYTVLSYEWEWLLQRIEGHCAIRPGRCSASASREPGGLAEDGDGSEAAAGAARGGGGGRAVRRRRASRPVANAGVGGPRGADAPRQQGPEAVHGREQLLRREGRPQGGVPADGGRRPARPRHQRELPRGLARARRRPRRRPLAQRRGTYRTAVWV